MPEPATNASNNWREQLLKSSLSKRLILIFTTIAVIDSALLAALCFDILDADRIAAREFSYLKICNSASSAFTLWENLASKIGDAWQRSRENPTLKYVGYKEALQKVFVFLEGMRKEMQEAGGEQTNIKAIENSLIKLDTKLEPHLKPDASGKAPPTLPFEAFYDLVRNLYNDFKANVLQFRQRMDGEAIKAVAIEKSARNLFYGAIAINALLVVLLSWWVDQAIVGPIVRLAKECEKLRLAQVLSKPKGNDTEIGALEQSFYKMSLNIHDVEKRRASYLELFRELQTASLKKAQSLLSGILSQSSASPGISERARKKLSAASDNLDNLVRLVSRMSETLDNKNTGASAKEQESEIQPALQGATPEINEANSGRLVQAAVSAVSTLSQKRNITITTEGLPFDCQVDSNQIERVLTNLLSNAIKYSPEAGKIIVRVEKHAGTSISFSVTDQGPGIAFEAQENLFKKFSKLDASDGIKRAGTGLGLNICKEIVEAHGGKLSCKSEPGKGSTFAFQIPLRPSYRNAQPPQPIANQDIKENRARNERETRRLSIKRIFALVLLSFLIPQAMLAFNLNERLHEAARRAKAYSEQKDLTLRAADLALDYANWKTEVLDAMRKLDVAGMDTVGLAVAAKTLHKGLHKLIEQCRSFIESTKENSALREAAKKLLIDEKRGGLIISRVRLDRQKDALDDSIHYSEDLEDDMSKIAALTAKNAEESYDGSSKLRLEILNELIASGVVTIILLSGAAVLALKLSGAVTQLREKTEAFARGERISESITGNNEMSWLDNRLCHVSATIREAEDQRQNLINVINHDLRTPLSSVLGSCQLVAMTENAPQNVVEQLSAVEFELKGLITRINDLLTLEKIEAGALKPIFENIEFASVLEQAITSALSDYPEAELDLNISPEAESAILHTEESLLLRLIEIPLANALQASVDTVKLSAVCVDGSLQIIVKDQGSGISAELLPEIFKRFRLVGGKPLTGLGLPLAKHISDLLGATITLTSTGAGTEVRMRLPLTL